MWLHVNGFSSLFLVAQIVLRVSSTVLASFVTEIAKTLLLIKGGPDPIKENRFYILAVDFFSRHKAWFFKSHNPVPRLFCVFAVPLSKAKSLSAAGFPADTESHIFRVLIKHKRIRL